MPARTFVIAGASLAGAKAAETLRAEGFDGDIVLIGAEEHRPYERPPLSKGFLLGKDEADSAFVHEAGWYAEHRVDLRTGVTVTGLDRSARQLTLSSGEPVGYDKLLIATGATPRRLRVPGADQDGVFYLRSLDDSERLKAALQRGGQVVIAGSGWIGLETAAAAREYGCEVTVVEPEEGPLYRSVGPEVGELFARLHRSHGVTFRFREGVTEVTGQDGKASGIITSTGTELPADVIIAGIGAIPNTAFAEAAGLDTDNGILADESLRTSDPDIYVAGDVARWLHPLLGRRIRVEHWGNALAGGPAAARAMLGQEVSYDLVPYFYSDQYDLGMEAAGLPEPGSYDQVLFRGDKDGLEVIVFWLSDSVVVAGMNINVWDVNDDIQALIRSGTSVDIARLQDTDVPLTEL
jgi:NADPH-dependent 2,4-dienoyl-CoA reductase/sulfur reductase-like enzyme